MAAIIADTACVDPRAEIADEVEIGPYCLVGAEVRLGKGTRLAGHVQVCGPTTLGVANVVRPFTVIGSESAEAGVPNRRDRGRLEVGDFNTICEGVTIARGGPKGDGITRIGSKNVLMASTHIGRDCSIGDRITLAQGVIIGASVLIEDDAVISSGAVIQPYATVGTLSFVAGRSRLDHDAPPYLYLDGLPAKPRCIHIVGLRRMGISREAISALHEAYRLLYRAKMEPRIASEILAAHGHLLPEVRHLLDSVAAQNSGRHRRARDRPKGGAVVEEMCDD